MSGVRRTDGPFSGQGFKDANSLGKSDFLSKRRERADGLKTTAKTKGGMSKYEVEVSEPEEPKEWYFSAVKDGDMIVMGAIKMTGPYKEVYRRKLTNGQIAMLQVSFAVLETYTLGGQNKVDVSKPIRPKAGVVEVWRLDQRTSYGFTDTDGHFVEAGAVVPNMTVNGFLPDLVDRRGGHTIAPHEYGHWIYHAADTKQQELKRIGPLFAFEGRKTDSACISILSEERSQSVGHTPSNMLTGIQGNYSGLTQRLPENPQAITGNLSLLSFAPLKYALVRTLTPFGGSTAPLFNDQGIFYWSDALPMGFHKTGATDDLWEVAFYENYRFNFFNSAPLDYSRAVVFGYFPSLDDNEERWMTASAFNYKIKVGIADHDAQHFGQIHEFEFTFEDGQKMTDTLAHLLCEKGCLTFKRVVLMVLRDKDDDTLGRVYSTDGVAVTLAGQLPANYKHCGNLFPLTADLLGCIVTADGVATLYSSADYSQTWQIVGRLTDGIDTPDPDHAWPKGPHNLVHIRDSEEKLLNSNPSAPWITSIHEPLPTP